VEARDAVLALARDYPRARVILIEDKANGRAIIESLWSVLGGIVPVDPKGGKFSRAQAVSPMIEQGHVWLPQPARLPWVQEFLAEARTFPVGAYDDQVDQMTQALQWWISVKDYAPAPQDAAPLSPRAAFMDRLEDIEDGRLPAPRPTQPTDPKWRLPRWPSHLLGPWRYGTRMEPPVTGEPTRRPHY
jgi:predicted phage terminase large subunit-like protein